MPRNNPAKVHYAGAAKSCVPTRGKKRAGNTHASYLKGCVAVFCVFFLLFCWTSTFDIVVLGSRTLSNKYSQDGSGRHPKDVPVPGACQSSFSARVAVFFYRQARSVFCVSQGRHWSARSCMARGEKPAMSYIINATSASSGRSGCNRLSPAGGEKGNKKKHMLHPICH